MWPHSQETANLVTFTEKIFNWNFYFLRSEAKMAELKNPIFCKTVFSLLHFAGTNDSPEANTEVSKTFKMELFAKIVNSFLADNFFCKKRQFSYLTAFWIRFSPLIVAL